MDYFCVDCGQILNESDIYCSNCGSNVEEIVDDHNFCPQCEEEIGGAGAFCSKCGTSLGLNGAENLSDIYQSPNLKSYFLRNMLPRWVSIFILFIILVFLIIFFKTSGSGSNPEKNSGNGYWVTKCRNVTELNPNYYDSDPSTISDNLSGPSRFTTRRECTEVWVKE